MSTDSAEFLLKMVDGASGPAGGAMASIRAMNQQLAALNAAQRLAGGGSVELHDKILQQKSALDSLKAALPALTAAEQASAAAAKAAAAEIGTAKADAAAKAAAAAAEQSAAAKKSAAAQRQAAADVATAKRQASADIAASAARERLDMARGAAQNARAAEAFKRSEADRARAARAAADAIKKAADDAAKAAKESADAASAAMAKTSSSVSAAGGPLSSIVEKFNSLTTAAGTSSGQLGLVVGAASAAAAGLMALVAGAVAAAAALTAVGLALTMFALKAADSHQAFLRTMVGAAGSAKAAEELQGALERVADASPLAKDQIEGFAHSLAVAGLKGKQFEETLKSMSTVTAIVGPEAAGHLQGIIDKATALGHFDMQAKGLKGLGISMGDLAAQMGMSVAKMEAAMKAGKISTEAGVDAMNKAIAKRFGGQAADAALGFSAQMIKLKDKIADLFEDINIKPFLTGLKQIVGLFDSGSATGKAMKTMVVGAFNAIFAAAGAVLPYVAAFLKGMVIGALQFYIAAKQLGKELGLVGGHGKSLVTIKDAVNAGKVAVGLFASAILGIIKAIRAVSQSSVAMGAIKIMLLGIVAVIAIAAASFLLMVAFVAVGVGLIVGAIGLIVAACIAMYNGVKRQVALVGAVFTAIVGRIKGAFAGLSLSGIASNLANSFISAIKGSIGKVVAAMTALGGAAMSALKSVLGIASPSKVMIEAGGNTATGFAQGIDKGNDKVATSSAKMGAAVKPGGAKGPLGGGGPITINFHGAREDFEDFKSMMAKLLDGEIAAGAEVVTG